MVEKSTNSHSPIPKPNKIQSKLFVRKMSVGSCQPKRENKQQRTLFLKKNIHLNKA